MTAAKKKLIAILFGAIAILNLCGCQQTMARKFGGDMTVELEPNQKLEMITWKDDDALWYLTRPMTEDDVAETHTFQADTTFGIFEGMVILLVVQEMYQKKY